MKKQIGVKLEPETIVILDSYAVAKKWTRSQAARIMIEEHLETQEVQQVIQESNQSEKEV